jgi:hypothetical protein
MNVKIAYGHNFYNNPLITNFTTQNSANLAYYGCAQPFKHPSIQTSKHVRILGQTLFLLSI